jgi:hypothetical protein
MPCTDKGVLQDVLDKLLHQSVPNWDTRIQELEEQLAREGDCHTRVEQGFREELVAAHEQLRTQREQFITERGQLQASFDEEKKTLQDKLKGMFCLI